MTIEQPADSFACLFNKSLFLTVIGRDFLQNAQDLCVEEFASEHIKPRKVNKAILSGEQLFVLAQTYVHAVNDSDGVLNAHLSEVLLFSYNVLIVGISKMSFL